jgi:hypothetical protein
VARIVETYEFGPHGVAVLEQVEDDGVSYVVLVDRQPVTEPLGLRPSLEDVVRIYARWKSPAQRSDPQT